ncbi:MAG: GDYXXLXY domain-containing protein [Chloroflexota bacterium]
MKMIRVAILFGTLAVFLYLINSGIASSERNIAEGLPAYLELAPVDPRSLIQGDYMTLSYAVERDIRNSDVDYEDRGQVVLTLDENQVATFESFYEEGQTLEANQVVVNYKARNAWRVQVGVDSFFFQEGQAEDYEIAEYAEVRILEGGGVMLINLADENLQTINPQ